MGFLDMLFSGIGSLFSVAVNVVSEVVSTVKTYLTAKEIVAKTVYDERDKKFNEYFNEKIELLEFDEPLIQDVIDNYLSQRYKKMIHRGDDEW